MSMLCQQVVDTSCVSMTLRILQNLKLEIEKRVMEIAKVGKATQILKKKKKRFFRRIHMEVNRKSGMKTLPLTFTHQRTSVSSMYKWHFMFGETCRQKSFQDKDNITTIQQTTRKCRLIQIILYPILLKVKSSTRICTSCTSHHSMETPTYYNCTQLQFYPYLSWKRSQSFY